MTGTPEKTPDQAAFDAFWRSPALGEEPPSPLDRESRGIRDAWAAVVKAVSGPLEVEIADLRLKLGKVRDMAESWTEIGDQWGEPTKEALAEAEYGWIAMEAKAFEKARKAA